MSHVLAQNGSKGNVVAVRIKKTPGFGILQRKGNVYTGIVPDCARKTLQAIIRGRIEPDSIIHSDSGRGYNGLVNVG